MKEMESEALPIQRDPGVLGAGRCSPARGFRWTLFEYLEDGEPLEVFLRNFPTVRREDVIQVLEHSTS